MSTNLFILHHYEASPYAEKIRLMFGRAGMEWGSVLAPPMPPRPSVDPLAGGYRRIPVAQQGADVFCDTALIAFEVSELAHLPALAPSSVDHDLESLLALAEGDVFFSAITGASSGKVLLNLLKQFGLFKTLRFIKDRSGMMQGGTIKPPQGAAARQVFDEYLDQLDEVLSSRDWLTAGQQPGYADFAAFHPIWLRLGITGSALDQQRAHLAAWYARVGAVGYGQRRELSADQAMAFAREASPRALPDNMVSHPQLHQRVSVAPSDYGRQAVVGELVAVTDERLIIARNTPDLGRVHVHFPVQGYEVKPA